MSHENKSQMVHMSRIPRMSVAVHTGLPWVKQYRMRWRGRGVHFTVEPNLK